MPLNRITIDPNQMSGEPCIRGLRIPVATVLSMLNQMTIDEILNAYPDLEKEDIAESIDFAAQSIRQKEIAINH
ncbi:DUF433 domain-containing protein [Ekhidna sp.]|uniref:DUF433 domain-containing protein n=1 Tax=Ekhidna sp. TaxID=2608089 RepID=UPI003CCBAAEA